MCINKKPNNPAASTSTGGYCLVLIHASAKWGTVILIKIALLIFRLKPSGLRVFPGVNCKMLRRDMLPKPPLCLYAYASMARFVSSYDPRHS